MKPQKTIRGYEIAGRMPLFQKWGRDAIREDRKTQTRRLNGLEIINRDLDAPWYPVQCAYDDSWIFWSPNRVSQENTDIYYPNGGGFKCPWKVGEYRVMTEPLRRGGVEKEGVILYYNDPNRDVIYDDTADLVYSNLSGNPLDWRWKRDTLSAMFMPTEAARTICQITNIRVERVRDISEKDSMAEGMGLRLGSSSMGHTFTGIEHFDAVWDSINKKRGYGWNVNPWVFVLSFKRV